MKGQEDLLNTNELFSTYEELVDDGKVYYETGDLERLNLLMMCKSKKGAIIMGPEGGGKTALVRRFAQQNLSDIFETDSVKVIMLYDEFISRCKEPKQAWSELSELCKKYENQSLILHAKFEEVNSIKAAMKLVNTYFDQIEDTYSLGFIKVIFEFSENSKEMPELESACSNTFEIFRIQMPQSLNEYVKVLRTKAKEFSEMYGIKKCSDSVVGYYIVVNAGSCRNMSNFNQVMMHFEKLFALAKKKNQSSITKELVREVFTDVFREISATSKEETELKAYHEIGHTLFVLEDDFRELNYVTIIPGKFYGGVTTSYHNAKRPPAPNRESTIFEMAKSLAGREAEKLVCTSYIPNMGASSDLEKAMNIAEDMLYHMGVSESFGDNYTASKDDYLSERLTEKIEREKAKLLKKAEETAHKEICKHKDFVRKLSKLLLKKLVLTGDEVTKMWKEYLKKEKTNNSNNTAVENN